VRRYLNTTEKARKDGGESDGKKDVQYAFIRSRGLHLTARKRAKKGEKARKMTERKMSNMHLLETDKANFKGCGKKGGKRVRRVRKGRKERWTICIY
jgi:hypothetical protein